MRGRLNFRLTVKCRDVSSTGFITCKGKAGEIWGNRYVSIALSSTPPLPIYPLPQFPVEIQKTLQYC